MIIGISVTLAEGCALLSRAIFTDSLFYVSRRRFRKLRFAWSIVGRGEKKMQKGWSKKGGRKMEWKMVLGERVCADA